MLFACCITYGQDAFLPKLQQEEFKKDHSKIDTSADAIILHEYGRTELEVLDAERRLMVVHTYNVRLKILNKDGDKYATVEIPLYKSGSTEEYLTEIKARTLNLENNTIQETELQRKNIFYEKTAEFYNTTKFTLPNIKENSIIEYSYKKYSPLVHNFEDWQFQGSIPNLYSEYIAVIPSNFEYNVTLKGHQPLSGQKSEVLNQHFLWNGARFDCSKMTYIMQNMPAFKEESFMLAPINYISAIDFELRTYTDPNGAKQNYTRTWDNIDTELLNDKDFGGQIKAKGPFKEINAKILAEHQTKLDQAKALYSYLQRNVVWNKNFGKYAEFGVKKTLEDKRGNLADINLGLVAGLNAMDIEAYPVITATRNRGIPSYIYPVNADFNAVICLAKIDGKDYLLDATNKFLPFGQLSLLMINDRGRAMYGKGKSDWVPLKNEVVAKKTFNILANISPDGKLKGTIRAQLSGLDAYRKRQDITEYPSHEEYEEKLMEKTTDFKILKSTVSYVDSLDKDLVEVLDFELDLKENMKGNRLVINPILIERMTKNPFLLEERNYHVDLGAVMSEVYNVNIMIPEGYKLDNGPKNTALSLPENAARYVYRSAIEGNSIMVQQTTNLNHPIYSPEEYFHLKEFFSRIIQQQQTAFTFLK